MALPQGKWVKLEQNGAGPGARSSHAVAVVGQKAYAFGGEFSPRVPVDNHLYVFDLTTRTWKVADARGDIPPPRVGVMMASIAEIIYVFGGRDATHKELNEKWIGFPPPGEKCKPRGGPGLASVQGKIWVVYGFSGEELDDVHCFDPRAGRWSCVETTGEKPTPRSMFSSVGIGKHIFIHGGEIDPSDLGHLGAGKFSKEVYALDTETKEWKRWDNDEPGSAPGERGWCAFSGGQCNKRPGLLVYGGNSPSNDRLDDIYFFTPSI
ncbi:nitrile-specifier protein 5 isoform X2 [Salvia divinorum]|uniref:Nitrile-specifier protein 5 isoform X2 n=1 Tax=Salvia divinorum TaxID=28513 RepID=A0ABD1I069_SALDI